MDSLLEQLNNHTALELTKNVYYYHPTYECESTAEHIKFFNALIHIAPKCLVRFLIIELFLASAEHVFFCCFSFIEHFYGMFKFFTERLLSNSVRD